LVLIPRSSPAPTPPLVLGLSPVRRQTIADGDRGTEQTINAIRRLVHQGMTDQAVNRLAIQIIQRAGVRQFDFVGEGLALYQWVLRNFRFVRDVAGVETLRTAREILTVQAGDCDDINGVLLPSLLATTGHDVRLVTISSQAEDPRAFSHIYCEAYLGDRWIPLDAARRDAAFGKGPRHYFRKRIWPLTTNGFQDVQGLGFYRSPLGDDSSDGEDNGFDWTGLATAIGAAGTAAGKIITSINTPSFAPTFARNPATGQLVPVTPQGTIIASSVPGGVVASGSGMIPDWMLFLGLGLGVYAAIK
jgi:hypothetical protein